MVIKLKIYLGSVVSECPNTHWESGAERGRRTEECPGLIQGDLSLHCPSASVPSCVPETHLSSPCPVEALHLCSSHHIVYLILFLHDMSLLRLASSIHPLCPCRSLERFASAFCPSGNCSHLTRKRKRQGVHATECATFLQHSRQEWAFECQAFHWRVVKMAYALKGR